MGNYQRRITPNNRSDTPLLYSMTLLDAQPLLAPKADREYVVGGASSSFYRTTRQQVLSLAFDDLTAELGYDLYQRMMNHPQVKAKINILITWILQSGVTFTPAVTDKTADGYEQATELVGWCERVFDDLDTSSDDVLYDMAHAIAYGCRVAELVSAYDTTYTGATQLVIRRLNVKPVPSVRFVVDDYLNVQGIYGGQITDGDGAPRPRILPREKFAIWSFRPTNNDPRGTSLLRSAYNSWNMYLQTLPEYYKYLVQFASPSLFGTTAENAKEHTYLDSNNVPRTMSAEEYMLTQLLAFSNGTAMAAPYGAVLDVLWSTGEGQAFLNAFQRFDNEIAVAITNQLLATEQGQYGSKSQAGVHQDAITVAIQQMKRSLCRMLRRDVLYDTVRVNYGDDVAALTPLVSLGKTEQRDWQGELRAATAGGYKFAPSHLPLLDARFELPARDGDEEMVGMPAPAAPTTPAESIDNSTQTPNEDVTNEQGQENVN